MLLAKLILLIAIDVFDKGGSSMHFKFLIPVIFTAIVISVSPSEATLFFMSGEENYSADSPLPTSIYIHGTGFSPAQDQGYTRATSGNPKGSKVLEWKTDVPNATDMFNELRYSVTPPNGGTLYMAFFIKVIKVNGVQAWPNAGSDVDQFDKAIELTGPNYRWGLDFGIHAQNGPPGTWNIFVQNPNPGHFNRECEVYDAYYQNYNGYGRGKFESSACQPNMGNPYYAMQYDKWYSVVFKVTFQGTDSGEIGMWINGTKVMQFTNIQTCGVSASSCSHTRPQLWGTYNQPSYNGPIHKRQLDAFVVTDDLSYLQANGYFSPPGGSTTATQPPSAPTNLTVR